MPRLVAHWSAGSGWDARLDLGRRPSTPSAISVSEHAARVSPRRLPAGRLRLWRGVELEHGSHVLAWDRQRM
ncbi:MAG: hypothetical protein M3281_01190 [Chloroflexota bacterium]|nr:hypothetical protein [Chloroflexota bacterium]